MEHKLYDSTYNIAYIVKNYPKNNNYISGIIKKQKEYKTSWQRYGIFKVVNKIYITTSFYPHKS